MGLAERCFYDCNRSAASNYAQIVLSASEQCMQECPVTFIINGDLAQAVSLNDFNFDEI